MTEHRGVNQPPWALPAGPLPQVRYRPRRLGHVNLFVSDMPRTMQFLTTICGFEETARESATGTGFVSNGNTHHDVGIIDLPGYGRITRGRPAIFMGPEHRGTGPALNHFGWEMETEAALVAAYRRAREAGLSPRVTDAASSRSNYVFDCEGIQHQFYSDSLRDWRTVYIGGETSLHSNPPWDPDSGPADAEPKYTVDPVYRRVEAAPLHPLRVTHAVITTEDFDRALEFYVNIAGLTVRHRVTGQDVAYLGGSASAFDLILVSGVGPSHRLHHASFEMAQDENVQDCARRLEASGVEVAALRQLPHKDSVFIRDPDGLLYEFYVKRTAPLDAVGAAILTSASPLDL